MEKKQYISPDVLKKIRALTIYTRRLLRGTFVGNYKAIQKGFGLEFDQIREYQEGDDVRFIDWKSSARMNKVLVKQYYQEQARTIWLLVDISSSTQFGSSGAASKRETIAQIASVLSIVANMGKDRVGLVLFAQDVEYCLPPAQGAAHIQEIMQRVFTAQARLQKTSIENAFKFLLAKKTKDAVVIMISDFLDTTFQKLLPLAASWYEIIAIRCLDAYEQNFPAIGSIKIQDIETGEVAQLDPHAQAMMDAMVKDLVQKQNTYFKKYGIKYLDISSSKPYMNHLVQFFQKRMIR